jgi:hypothetical protein
MYKWVTLIVCFTLWRLQRVMSIIAPVFNGAADRFVSYTG